MFEDDLPPGAPLPRMRIQKFRPSAIDQQTLYRTCKRCALKEVNRQIRTEARPLWLKSRQTMVDMLDLEAWCRTFYPTMEPGELDAAPTYLAINMTGWYGMPERPDVDILPLLRMALHKVDFQYGFDIAKNDFLLLPTTRQHSLLRVFFASLIYRIPSASSNIKLLHALMEIRDATWVQDLQTGANITRVEVGLDGKKPYGTVIHVHYAKREPDYLRDARFASVFGPLSLQLVSNQTREDAKPSG